MIGISIGAADVRAKQGTKSAQAVAHARAQGSVTLKSTLVGEFTCSDAGLCKPKSGVAYAKAVKLQALLNQYGKLTYLIRDFKNKVPLVTDGAIGSGTTRAFNVVVADINRQKGEVSTWIGKALGNLTADQIASQIDTAVSVIADGVVMLGATPTPAPVARPRSQPAPAAPQYAPQYTAAVTPPPPQAPQIVYVPQPQATFTPAPAPAPAAPEAGIPWWYYLVGGLVVVGAGTAIFWPRRKTSVRFGPTPTLGLITPAERARRKGEGSYCPPGHRCLPYPIYQ